MSSHSDAHSSEINAAPAATPAEAETKQPVVSPGAVAPKQQASDDKPRPSVEFEYTQMVIQDTLAVLSHNFFTVLLQSKQLRAAALRYVNSTRASPSIFMQLCVTGWSEVREVAVSDPRAPALFHTELMSVARACQGTDSFAMLINYTPAEHQVMVVSLMAIVKINRNEQGGAQSLSGETYEKSIERQTDNSTLFAMSVQYDIASLGENTETMKKMLNNELARRFFVAQHFSATKFDLDAREACIRFDIHNKVTKPDKAAIAAAENSEPDADGKRPSPVLPPWQCFKVICGAQMIPRVQPMSEADVKESLASARTMKVDSEKDQLVQSHQAVLDAMSQPRRKYEAVVFVVRALYGPCAPYIVSEVSVMDMELLGQGADDERKSRIASDLKKRDERAAAKK